MGYLGVHFSLDERIVNRLRSYKRESARLNYVQEKLEEDFWEEHPEWGCETDKAWDAIHRTLTDGDLDWSNGQYPLNHIILGGELLYAKPDYIMSLKTAQQVQDAAIALKGITKKQFRERYFNIVPEQYGFPVNDQNFDYAWTWFERLREFWYQVAKDNRYILFTADL
jgi:uncharacterized protein DUF1877